jgi:endonuclease YncB( thermonuclease family)
VQGFGQAWLQSALLEQGLARVQISPDRTECAPDLYEAEIRARSRQVGIWALPGYRVRTPQQLAGAAGTFQLVEGKIDNIGRANGRTFIDFGNRQFSAVVQAGDRRAFRDFDFDELTGRHVRVRGIVQNYRGRPEIVLSNPYQIELLD